MTSLCTTRDIDKDLRLGLKRAAEIIDSGGVVAFPTESFYGLAVSSTDEKAIQRLIGIKKRGKDQPILILIPSIGALDQYVIHIPETARQITKRFWPGGLTLVFKAKPNVSRLLTGGTGKIGLRLSSHPVATALSQAVGVPITGTSANISGQPACLSAKAVRRSFGKRVDFVLDAGETKGGKGSTILDVTADPPIVLREGMVSQEALDQWLK